MDPHSQTHAVQGSTVLHYVLSFTYLSSCLCLFSFISLLSGFCVGNGRFGGGGSAGGSGETRQEAIGVTQERVW